MRYKVVLLVFLGLLFIVALAQIFMLYPSAETLFPLYKSGYFSELDRQYRTIANSFTTMKLYGQNEFAWAFLTELAGKENIAIKVYDERGERIVSPGITDMSSDLQVRKMTQSLTAEPIGEVHGNLYYGAIPIFYDKRCLICHKDGKEGKLAGVMTFERTFDA
ncbi:MAG TPA: hypothetical protein VF857_02960, partial [Spirochaetota bacterium]